MKTLMVVTLLFSSLAQAGGTAHGGDAVRCWSESTKTWGKVELFDYFIETDKNPEMAPQLGAMDLNYKEKVKIALDRLKLDPVAQQVYSKRADQFENEAAFVTRSLIPEIDDEKSVISPKGPCYKIQWAAQVANPRPPEKRYLVDKELWDNADETARAGLVLHEIIFTDVIAALGDAATSDGVRVYNAILASDWISNLDAKTYGEFLINFGLIHPLGNVIRKVPVEYGYNYYYQNRSIFFGKKPLPGRCGGITCYARMIVSEDPTFGGFEGLVESTHPNGIVLTHVQQKFGVGDKIHLFAIGANRLIMTGKAGGEKFKIEAPMVEAMRRRKQWVDDLATPGGVMTIDGWMDYRVIRTKFRGELYDDGTPKAAFLHSMIPPVYKTLKVFEAFFSRSGTLTTLRPKGGITTNIGSVIADEVDLDNEGNIERITLNPRLNAMDTIPTTSWFYQLYDFGWPKVSYVSLYPFDKDVLRVKEVTLSPSHGSAKTYNFNGKLRKFKTRLSIRVDQSGNPTQVTELKD